MRSTKRIAHAELVERAHHLPEVPDARQQDLRCAPQPFGIADQRVVAANLTQRILYGAQISCSVIEDRDHSSPLVDGN